VPEHAPGVNAFDVAILGAGPAGSATALALSSTGLSVVLVDRRPTHVPCGETLPPAIRRPLGELGVWDRFLADGHFASCGTRAVWGGPYASSNDFLFNPYGPGWHVARDRFDDMLRAAASERGANVVRTTTSVVAGVAGNWHLVLDSAHTRHAMRARLVVDATGRSSVFARRFAGQKIPTDRLIGLVTSFAPPRDAARQRTHCMTLIEAARSGWWYAAEVPGGRLVLAHMTDADLLASSRRGNPRHWFDELGATRDVRRWTAALPTAEPQTIAAANTARLPQASGDGWIAVGDAAMTLDPLSSQGIFMALESGLKAARAICSSFAGDAGALGDYAAWSAQRFVTHLKGQAYYYAKERRWVASEFWRRRLGGAAGSAGSAQLADARH